MLVYMRADTPEELELLKKMINGETIPEKKTKTRSEINRQNYERRKAKSENQTVQTECVEEEREEKEEVLPLSSPSSLLPPNPYYPITPYNPPLPEEREEREEDIFGGAVGKRGELKSFGPHVMLSEEEYLRLQKDFGYEETLRMIQDMNNYIGEDPKLIAKYKKRNHNLTLRNWKNRDEKKNRSEKQKTTKELIDEMDWSGWDE